MQNLPTCHSLVPSSSSLVLRARPNFMYTSTGQLRRIRHTCFTKQIGSKLKVWNLDLTFPSPIPQGEPPQGEQATLLVSSHACPHLAVRHIHHGVAGWFTQLYQSWLTLEDGQRTGCEPVESSLPHWGLKLTAKFSLALKKGKALWAGWRQRSLDSEEGGSVPPWLCYSFLGDFRQVTF